MANAVFTPILDGGTYSINFFNGRLLSAEDLSQEQCANRRGRRRLGRAIGDGVAFGLQVSLTASSSPPPVPSVTIKAGLAVNREGQTLRLLKDVDVSLVRPASTSSSPALTGFGECGSGQRLLGESPSSATEEPAVFGECKPIEPGTYVAGAGVYILTIAPAVGSEGRAPVSGLGNIAATCNTRYQVEGIQFGMLALNSLLGTLGDQAHLRNRLAYRCFGVSDTAGFIANPFGPRVTTYGLLDDLRPYCLTNAEVPLAVIYWTAEGIRFIDMWSVRRRITRPPSDQDWAPFSSDRRASEAEAMFLQFQEQIEEILVNETDQSSLVATDRFWYLPPVGVLPIANQAGAPGIAYEKFFANKPYRDPLFIEGARLQALVHESLAYPPIDLTNPEFVWLYEVRENAQAVEKNNGQAPRRCLVFANGHIPPYGEARYDVNYWDYSNYA